MKKLLLNNGYLFQIDLDANTVKKANYQRGPIDTVYLIKEDCTLTYQEGDNTEDVDVKKDDIVITFYDSDYPNKALVISNDKWAANIKAAESAEQKRKEEWAEKKCQCDCGLKQEK